VTLAVTVGVVVAVYNMGGGQDEPATRPTATAERQGLSPADRARAAGLVEKLDANPKDVAALVALGDLYFKAGDYKTAGTWMEHAIAIDPENVRARLALGAAKFNLGDAADARRDWLRVIAADPENVEAYYDLGFLYLSENPPDTARAKKMWRKVVEIAPPGSSVAKTVAAHLKGLKEQGPQTAAPAREAG
jgi:tetratricopeptide (TPR) repeat protein